MLQWYVTKGIELIIQELSSQWVGDEAADLCSFVPFVMTINVDVQDFEVSTLNYTNHY